MKGLELKNNIDDNSVISGCYVIVARNDQPFTHKDGSKYYDNKGDIVLETYLSDATLENTKKRIEKLNGKLGQCRIAKLEFTNER